MAIALVSQALCSVSDVKLQMATDTDTTKDDLIALFINAFAQFAESYTGRPFELTERTEFFDAGLIGAQGGPTSRVQLSAFPVSATATLSIYDDPAWTFDATTLLTENDDYTIDRVTGIVRRARFQAYQHGQPLTGVPSAYFKGGPKSIKAISTGGLVTPRPAGPATPTTATAGTGLTGTYRHVITTVTAAGVESVASTASNPLAVTNQSIAVTFLNPGTGLTTRIYRIKNGGTDYYYSGSLAGSGAGGSQSYTDAIIDAGLDTSRTPPEAGPLTVPSDLRLASVMQCGVMYRNRQNYSMQSITVNDAGTARLVDPTAMPRYVRDVLDGYVA